MTTKHLAAAAMATTACWTVAAVGQTDKADVKAEHGMIGVSKEEATRRTTHPDAQWFPDAGLGLFLHWSPCSVREMNISWPMIPGRPLGAKKIDDPAERERIVREGDWNLDGKPNAITPRDYWAMAKEFNPEHYDPDHWMKAARDAGMKYAVLTTRHHDGFAMWPSNFGDYSTKNYMGGRDLVKGYVDACRRNGIKVGLYYSPPNWWFDRDYMSFLYHGARRTNPWVPALDVDLKVNTERHTEAEIKAHQEAYANLVRGQVEELLTNYGKIDLLWFDGKPGIPDGENVISMERIRALQPGIVVNPRLHGHGDYLTFERKLNLEKPIDGWGEFCNPLRSTWSFTKTPLKADGYVLVQLVQARSVGVNYLLGIGPMADGELNQAEYTHLETVARWMDRNAEAVHDVRPLPKGETASVPAVATPRTRYLFAVPAFAEGKTSPNDILPARDETLTFTGTGKPASVRLLGDGSVLESTFEGGVISIQLPAGKRTKMVDVVKIELTP